MVGEPVVVGESVEIVSVGTSVGEQEQQGPFNVDIMLTLAVTRSALIAVTR